MQMLRTSSQWMVAASVYGRLSSGPYMNRWMSESATTLFRWAFLQGSLTISSAGSRGASDDGNEVSDLVPSGT